MRPRVGLVVPASPSGEQGGAERFFAGLRDALEAGGTTAEIVPAISDESDFARIEESYLRFYDLDLSRFDGVITSKAPAYAIRHPNHVCYLQHTMRVFYDMFDIEFPRPWPELEGQRRLVHALDTAALQPSRLRGLFAIGEEVAGRLRSFNGLDAPVMHHPSTLTGLRHGPFRHLLMPGRLHRWKRVDLAIEAMRHVSAPVELVISGTGEDAAALRAMAEGEPRIRFTGRVTDRELVDLYADALAVLFLPRREDLGLITLEAWLAGKPVITCADSGEPARLVRNGENGYVCPPDPVRIAARIDALAADATLASRLGAAGETQAAAITWPGVATPLLTALGFPPASAAA